ncbi:acyl-CoA dehydrogenase domain-containing protein [Hyphomonas polymorpha PS728]|uniref:Acyl-CoA dehydrogenase domain-containing protein n=1 Tax=Hyphomonas polymorpha PS728 TaxID=1280954 RepID=A0A062V3Y1_9PROT|nr:acyl-CoA dehydrogenase family protein [Hyphomonas polymorpha]KCZ96613.1 acyl-CoA dehydrogenase domain-containing protein [Hyphomonas polymorpha PS728]
MSISYSEDQAIFRDSLTKFLLLKYSFEKRQSIVDSEEGFSREIWKGLSELGVLGLTFPPSYGGFGGTAIDVHIVMETFGRFLVVEPFVPTVVVFGGLLKAGGSEQQKAELIPKIINGELICAVGLIEHDSRDNFASVGTVAIPTGEGFLVSGAKSVVLGAPQADKILISARIAGDKIGSAGISLFLIDANAEGVKQRAYRTVDGMRAAEVVLTNVAVTPYQMIGKSGEAYELIEGVMDDATSAMCAECVGAMKELNQRTIDYCRTRSAFENTLSQFQVVRHKLVDMRIAYEHALALSVRAAREIEAESLQKSEAVSAAKVQVFKEAEFVSSNSIQLHGAIGMTDELDVGHYVRRIVALETTGGDCAHHTNRFARLIDLRNHSGVLSADFFGKLNEAEVGFQADVQSFLEKNLSDDMRLSARYTAWAFAEFEQGCEWHQILAKRGWGAPHWPVEYGGVNWSPVQKLIWSVECLRADAPMSMNMGRDLVGPCIMKFGTGSQKAEFLPAILNGTDWWAQGFSEPQAGSDLAALQLDATSDGDSYILNGSKIWTTFAQHANRIFCLVRTGRGLKKQMGISVLLIDLDTPGIEIRPIRTIAGDEDFNQVFFTNVRVPKARLLGRENEGWSIVRYLLQFEHGLSVCVGVSLQQMFWRLRDLLKAEPDGLGGKLLDSETTIRSLAEMLLEIKAVACLDEQIIAATLAGQPPLELGEIVTIRSREVGHKLNKMVMRAAGQYSRPYQKDARTLGSGAMPVGPLHSLMAMPYYLAQLASTIAGGTQEVRKNNLARGLLNL